MEISSFKHIYYIGISVIQIVGIFIEKYWSGFRKTKVKRKTTEQCTLQKLLNLIRESSILYYYKSFENLQSSANWLDHTIHTFYITFCRFIFWSVYSLQCDKSLEEKRWPVMFRLHVKSTCWIARVFFINQIKYNLAATIYYNSIEIRLCLMLFFIRNILFKYNFVHWKYVMNSWNLN